MPLQVSIVKYDKNYIELLVKGETHTLFAPLIDYLLKHPDVEYAMYDVDHPLLQNVKFRLKTKTRDPIEVLKEAISAIVKDIDEFREKLLSKL